VNEEKSVRGFFAEKFSGSSMGILSFSTYKQYPEDFFQGKINRIIMGSFRHLYSSFEKTVSSLL
jgi:hypothetical protein